jgi:outer membrane protein TolC
MSCCATVRRTVLALSLVLPLLSPVSAQDRQLDPDVEKLLRERLVILQEAAKLRREAYRTGTTSLTSTLATDGAVLEAELELAKTPAERVKVREEMLKNAETLEKATEQLASAAETPRMELLTARANRLRAAANLLMERKAAVR